MCGIFENRNVSYNLRSQTDFMRTSVNNSNYGISSLKYLATKVWDIVPCGIKSIENVECMDRRTLVSTQIRK